jgi:hypothetical protein
MQSPRFITISKENSINRQINRINCRSEKSRIIPPSTQNVVGGGEIENTSRFSASSAIPDRKTTSPGIVISLTEVDVMPDFAIRCSLESASNVTENFNSGWQMMKFA